MASLTAFKFSTPEGAEQMLGKVKELQKAKMIEINDAAIVTWPEGADKPKTRQEAGMGKKGALKGAFWGLLFGLIFAIPIAGLAVGAAIGTVAGTIRKYGIDEEFIDQVRSKVTEGTSALFLMTSNAVMDQLKEELKGYQFELIASNLSQEQEKELTEAFGE